MNIKRFTNRIRNQSTPALIARWYATYAVSKAYFDDIRRDPNITATLDLITKELRGRKGVKFTGNQHAKNVTYFGKWSRAYGNTYSV